MRTRITGAAIVAATTLLVFHTSPMQKEEIKPTISLQKDEVPVSTSHKGAALVLSTG